MYIYGNLNPVRTLISGNSAAQGAEVGNNPCTDFLITASNFNLFGHNKVTNAEVFDNFTPGATDITATSNGNTPTPLGTSSTPILPVTVALPVRMPWSPEVRPSIR